MTASDREAVDGFLDALLDNSAEQLYDRAPCGYLSTTPDGVIVKVNQTFLTMGGFARDALVGRRRFADLLTMGGKIYHETHFAPMLRMQGSAREIALDLVRGDGAHLPVLVNAVLERDPSGAPVVIRVAVFDATHRREYERELLRAKERAEVSEARATALARTLQQTLIPPTPPVIPHLDVAAEYRPAGDGTQVGGDFYDVFQVGDADWAIVIGDVCGKGAEAAVVTALARYTLRAAAVEDPSPVHALRVLNQVLRRQGSDRFCTVVMMRLRHVDGAWTSAVTAGGHPLPLLVRRDGRVTTAGQPGSLLGVVDEIDVTETFVTLRAGDALLLYTDGVPDGRRGDAFYGEERLAAVAAAARGAAHTLTSELLADLMDFQGGVARDDIAIVAVRVPDRG